MHRERYILLEECLRHGAVTDGAQAARSEAGGQVHWAVVIPRFDTELIEQSPHELFLRQRKRVGDQHVEYVPRVNHLARCLDRGHLQTRYVAETLVQRSSNLRPAQVPSSHLAQLYSPHGCLHIDHAKIVPKVGKIHEPVPMPHGLLCGVKGKILALRVVRHRTHRAVANHELA